MATLEAALDLHFDPEWGSPYWLERQAALGFDVRTEVRIEEDLHRLGRMDAGVLRSRPLMDFVPRSLWRGRAEMILAETGGTTGAPCRRVWFPDEFDAAFAAPWERAADLRGFPRGANWLWLGPSGPHVIHRAARAMARRLGSLEPFSVDCDPRWSRRQIAGSLGHRLYADHVVSQALAVVRAEPIEVLFTTPPLLLLLAERMSVGERKRVRGIHVGGLPMDGPLCRRARGELFPHAVVLPGYGNSLFGVAFESLPPGADDEPVYFEDDSALRLRLAPWDPDDPEEVNLTREVAEGERGRVVVHRFDESFLLVNFVERDTATRATRVQEGPFAGRSGITGVGSAEQRRAAHLAVVY